LKGHGTTITRTEREAHEFFHTEAVVIAELKALHLASRIATSAKICAAPENYKVCGQCLSIVLTRAKTCPLCAAYRFYESPDAVRLVAGLTERVAFPLTAGTVPRISSVVREPPNQKEIKNGN
jgi:hypothetical protein